MVQAMQVFSAPGDEDAPLPVVYPGWSFDREVYLPLWDWYLIVDQARSRDAGLGELLAEVSGSADPADPLPKVVPGELLDRLVEFVERLAAEFAGGVDLAAEQAERDLGDYSSVVYADMLRAVGQVLREARRTGEPFEAWNE